MAQYDGSIRINTGIDVKGFEKGKKELESNTKSAAKSIDASIKGMEREFEKLDKSIWKTAQEITSLTLKANDMRNLQIPTKEYADAQKEVDKYTESLQKAKEKIDKLLETGVSKESSRFVSAQYDVAKLENKLLDAEEVVKRLEQEGKAFTLGSDTNEFANISNQIEDLTQKMQEKQQKQLQLQSDIEEKKLEKIKAESAEEERLAKIRENAVVGSQRIVKIAERRKQLLQEIADMEAAGIGAGYRQYDSAKQEIAEIEQKIKDYSNGIKEAKENYKKLGDIAKKSFSAIGNVLKSANSTIDSFGRKIKSIVQSHLPNFRKETDKTGNSFTKFNARLKSLLSGIFIFNVISSGFRKMFSGIKEGFNNFYSQSSAFSSSIDNMRQSLSYLQNSFAAAFSPIIEVAIPYIQKLIDYMAKAVNAIAQFIAALFGKKTYAKATGAASNAISDIGSSADKSNKSINKTSSALGNVADSATEAKKALEGYLSPLDEINKYKTDSDSSSLLGNISSGGVQVPNVGAGLGNAAGDAFGEYFENAIEEIPIESYFKELAEKVKDVISQLFKPLKEAWSGEGKFVMDSWKSALKEVGNLIKSVGSDFLEVWQQEKTVKIFEDLLHIIGDIGQVVSNLARNFRLAWNEGETGKRILEGIRDIIGVIVANIRHAADVTVEWAKNIDFTPLLTKMKDWVASLVPVIDNLSGIVTDFYEQVLLPLGKWVLEKGLPDLLQVFIDFNNKVDWEALRARLAEFWKHLEPFAETVGQGLIIFIGRLADALANFINSPAFENFLFMIEDWMKNVKPENVANAIEKLAIAIISIKGATMGFSAISSVIPVFKNLASVLGLFGPAGIAAGALALAGFLSKTIEDVNMAKVGQAVGNAIEKLLDFIGKALGETNWYMLGQKVVDFIAGIDWVSLFTTLVENLFKILGNVIGGSIALVAVLAESIGNLIANAIESAGEYFQEKIEECGGNIVLGILKGIADAIVGIGEWIVENIFEPFIDGFKDAFGIHSPSTVMQEMGKYIIEGLLKGIKSLVGDIEELWKSMKQKAVDTWNTVKDSLADTWSSIKQTASQKWQEIKQNLSEKWNNLKSNAKDSFESIGSSIKVSWENVKSSSVSFVSSMMENIREKFGNIQSSISNFSSGIQSKWQSVWSTMQSKVQSVMESVKSSLNSAFEWINKKIQDIQKSIKGISTSAQKVTAGGIGGAIGGGFGKVSYYSANPAFAALNSVEIPKLATGAVIPANREFLAVLGDQKRGTNLEAPAGLIEQITEKSVMNALSKIGLSGGKLGGTPVNVTLQVTLDKAVLGQKMIDWGKIQQMATGNNPYALGNT